MTIELTARATKDLNRLHHAQPVLFQKLTAKIQSLANEPRSGKPLVGPLKSMWSLRVGDYRIIYQIGKNAVVVLTVNHRRDVYR